MVNTLTMFALTLFLVLFYRLSSFLPFCVTLQQRLSQRWQFLLQSLVLFAIMNALGYDLNRLTLIGLTLAIGIFIDDAIVVIENIMKKMEEGKEPFEASFEGIKEVAFSILAISSVLWLFLSLLPLWMASWVCSLTLLR